MSDISDAKWEALPLHHNNWIPGAMAVFGLRWEQDPWAFTHRALVFYTGEAWRMQAWSVQPARKRNTDNGSWVDCGGYNSKVSAMRAARNMAKLFHGLAPEPPGGFFV